jgi:putative ABC transport system substrate-binding protein
VGKVPRIGFLDAYSPNRPGIDAFREGLRKLGYIEGQNLVIEWRWAEGSLERLPVLAAELVRLKVDVIVASPGTPPTVAAKNATTTIPIVFTTVGDPVAQGLVAGLARPGGNLTGLTVMSTELIAKGLELLKEAVPTISRVAVLWNPANPAFEVLMKGMEIPARRLDLELQPVGVKGPSEFEVAFTRMKKERADGLFVQADTMFSVNLKQLVDLAARHRLPAMYRDRRMVEAGGLMAYGPDAPDMYRRAATYVDKILKGAKPADLPVEQPTRFELVINLKTAKALGLTIPQSILIRADQVLQ